MLLTLCYKYICKNKYRYLNLWRRTRNNRKFLRKYKKIKKLKSHKVPTTSPYSVCCAKITSCIRSPPAASTPSANCVSHSTPFTLTSVLSAEPRSETNVRLVTFCSTTLSWTISKSTRLKNWNNTRNVSKSTKTTKKEERIYSFIQGWIVGNWSSGGRQGSRPCMVHG